MEGILAYLAHTFTITKIKACFTVILWIFSALIGEISIMIQAMFILLMLDFFLGFLLARIKWEVSKKKMQLGIVKMVAYCITLIVFHYTDISVMQIDINGFWVMEFGVSYLAVNEALSCLKHLSCLWVPIPQKIIDKLENYKDNIGMKDFK